MTVTGASFGRYRTVTWPLQELPSAVTGPLHDRYRSFLRPIVHDAPATPEVEINETNVHTLIDYVTIAPPDKLPKKGDEGYLQKPDGKAGYVAAAKSKVVAIVIHFVDRMWMAPLEIRFTGDGKSAL